MILTAPDLVKLTGRKRPKAQARQLERLGIPYKRLDSSVIVSEKAVEKVLGGESTIDAPREFEMNL